MSQLAKAVAIAIALHEARRIPDPFRTHTYFSANDLWQYIAITDDRTCNLCLEDDTKFFMGNEIRSLFPFWQIVDDGTIRVHGHMPRDDNCRCILIRITEPTHYIPIMEPQ